MQKSDISFYIIFLVALSFSGNIHSQKEFNIGIDVGASGNIGLGFVLSGNIEYKWNERFSFNSQLFYSNVYQRERRRIVIVSHERWVSSNPTYFEYDETNFPYAEDDTYLESLEDGIRHMKPGKNFRHDVVLNNSLRYYYAIGDKWRHYINLGVGVGIANESVILNQFALYDLDPETLELTYQVARRTKYLYLNGFSSIGTEYNLSNRISLTSSLSYMVLPRFRNVEHIRTFGKFDEHIFTLTIGIKSIIRY